MPFSFAVPEPLKNDLDYMGPNDKSVLIFPGFRESANHPGNTGPTPEGVYAGGVPNRNPIGLASNY